VKPVAGGRQASIDVLRAVAIVLMVVVHFVENLSGWYGEADNVFAGVHRVWWLPTGFAAPIFTFLAGTSYRLWLDLQRRKGRTDEAIAKGTVRRGLFLVGLGFAFNVFVWLPEDVFNWDILTLIGCGLIVLEVARRMPDGVVLFAAGLVAAVAPAMREVAGYAEYWSEGYFDYDFTVADVTLGWLVTGYFPLFPWLAYPLAGYALAPRLVGQARSLPGTALGAALIAAGWLVGLAWPSLPTAVTGGGAQAWTMFPASAAYVLGTLGTVVMALALLHSVLDGDEPRFAGLVAWAAPLSRHSLSLYLLHHVVHIWPLWAAGLATTGDATALWQIAIPPAASLALAGAFLLAAAGLCRWADRRRLPTAEALMRWLCD
jgi:uncharacterized membrane protein